MKKSTDKEQILIEGMSRYINELKHKDATYRKKEAVGALARTGVITKKGTLKKRIVSY